MFDPHPDAERRIARDAGQCRRACARGSTLAPLPAPGRLRFVGSIAEAVAGADLVQESAPEREDLKRRLLREIDAHARPDALVCSSTSGLLPSRLQAEMAIPAASWSGIRSTRSICCRWSSCAAASGPTRRRSRARAAIYAGLGMRPLHVRREIDGFIADRLLEALWREALWLVHDEVATVEEVDDAIRFGAGLRWAFMGTFLIYRLAGGEDGMRHFMAQFGPALQLPWTKLMEVPELTDDFIDRLAAQSDAQAGGMRAARAGSGSATTAWSRSCRR